MGEYAHERIDLPVNERYLWYLLYKNWAEEPQVSHNKPEINWDLENIAK